jgi:hypothetical protein
LSPYRLHNLRRSRILAHDPSALLQRRQEALTDLRSGVELILPDIGERLDPRIAFLREVLRVDEDHGNVLVERVEDGPAQGLGIVEFDSDPVGLGGDIGLQELRLQIDVAALRRAVDGIDAQVPAGVLDAALHYREKLDLGTADEVHIVLRLLILGPAGSRSCREARDG